MGDVKHTNRGWTAAPGADFEASFFQTLLDQITQAVVVTTPDLTAPGPHMVYVNAAFERQTGYPAAELLGHSVQMLQGPLTDRTTLDRARTALQTTGAFTGEVLSYRKDGTSCLLAWQMTALRDAQGTVQYWVARQRDITEERRAEETLQTQARVLNNMGEGVQMADTQGRIFLTNPAWDAMFGYTHGELIGQHVSVLNDPPEEAARIADGIIEGLKTTGAWFGEVKNRKKDGTRFFTSARVGALEMSGQTYWVTVQEDITERKRAEEALHQAHAQLEQRVAERTVELTAANQALRAEIVERQHAVLAEASPGSVPGKMSSPLWRCPGR